MAGAASNSVLEGHYIPARRARRPPRTRKQILLDNVRQRLSREDSFFAEMMLFASEQKILYGDDTYLDFIAKLEHRPVGIEEFLDSKDFFGACDVALWPEVRRAAIALNRHWYKGERNGAYGEFLAMSATASGKCLSGDTEFLTPTGWKRIDAYEEGDRVAQYLPNGTVEFVHPEEYIVEPNQRFYDFQARGVSMRVTPNHRIIYETTDYQTLREARAEDVARSHNSNRNGFSGRIICAYRLQFSEQGLDLTDAEIRLMVAVKADGNLYNRQGNNGSRCTMRLKKERKKQRIRWLLRQCGIEYRETQNAESGFSQFMFDPPEHSKSYEGWYGIDSEQADVFLNEVLRWDGTDDVINQTEYRQEFFTSDRASADFVQFVASGKGIRASLYTFDRRGERHSNSDYEHKSIEYTVRFTENYYTSIASSRPTQVSLTEDTDTAYCFRVPSGMLVVRHNDKVFVTGNSELSKITTLYHLYLMMCLKNPQALFGLPKQTSLVCMLQSAKPNVTKKVLYAPLKAYIATIPWFQKHAPPSRYIDAEVFFPEKNIRLVPSGGDSDAVLGEAIYSCFPAEQEFLLADGTVARMGDVVFHPIRVLTCDPEGNFIASPETRVVPTGEQELIELQFHDGTTLICTPDQKIMDSEGFWVAASEAKERYFASPDLQALRSEGDVPYSAPAVGARYDRTGVQGEVPGGAAHRVEASHTAGREQEDPDTSASPLSRLWAWIQEDQCQAHEATWPDHGAVQVEVPERTDSCDGLEKSIRNDWQTERGGPISGSCIQGSTAARDGQGATIERNPHRRNSRRRSGSQGSYRKTLSVCFGRVWATLSKKASFKPIPLYRAGAVRVFKVGYGGQRSVLAGLYSRAVRLRRICVSLCLRKDTFRKKEEIYTGLLPAEVGLVSGVQVQDILEPVFAAFDGFRYPETVARLDREVDRQNGFANRKSSYQLQNGEEVSDRVLSFAASKRVSGRPLLCTAVRKTGRVCRTYDVENSGSTHTFVCISGNRILITRNCIVDEVNFMNIVQKSKKVMDNAGRGGTYDQAQTLHTTLMRRREGRFMYNGPRIGVMCFLSSARYKGDFTEKRAAAIRENGIRTAYIYSKTQYEAKPADQYCGDIFRVVVHNDSASDIQIVEDNSVKVPREVTTLEVPVEYLEQFKLDAAGALRDICGLSATSIAPFFRQRTKIQDAVTKGEEAGLTSFLVRDNVVLGVDGMPRGVKDHYCKNPSRARYVHVDLAVNGDRAGICMLRVDGMIEVEREDGLLEDLPEVTMEMAVTIEPDHASEIDIAELRSWVVRLRTKYGYPIRGISYDGWQSVESRQVLKKGGFKTGQVSVDRNSAPYRALRDAIYDGRVLLYQQDVLLEELSNLEFDDAKDKVDHSPSFGKDCADALCGAYWTLLRRSDTWSSDGEGGDRPSGGDRFRGDRH